MPSYEELKTELLEISKIVEKLPEQVRVQAYELLVSEFLGHPASDTRDEKPKPIRRAKRKSAEKPGEAGTAKPTSKKRGSAASKEAYSIDRNLNLRGDKSMPSFRDFHEEKAPANAKEFNAVAVYYLEKIAGISKVSLDMAYTCYAEVSRKPPNAFRQSFIDTKNKAGWVEFDEDGNLKVPHRGSVFVEHDLPRPEAKKPGK